jgi:hypothetical protein
MLPPKKIGAGVLGDVKMYISIQANSLSLDSVIRAVSTTKIGIESD